MPHGYTRWHTPHAPHGVALHWVAHRPLLSQVPVTPWIPFSGATVRPTSVPIWASSCKALSRLQWGSQAPSTAEPRAHALPAFMPPWAIPGHSGGFLGPALLAQEVPVWVRNLSYPQCTWVIVSDPGQGGAPCSGGPTWPHLAPRGPRLQFQPRLLPVPALEVRGAAPAVGPD